jgi:uncharacterized protein YhbP (UPF0306 family)
MTRDELELIITTYMDSLTTMTLACCADGKPWAAAVYYARSGLDLVFFSSPASRHSEWFAANAAAAATIQGCYEGWREIRGLQLQGTVRPIEGARDRVRALGTYLHRFPFAAELLKVPESISLDFVRKMAKVKLYVFATETVLYLDNSIGFGTKWKLTVDKGRAVGESAQV